ASPPPSSSSAASSERWSPCAAARSSRSISPKRWPSRSSSILALRSSSRPAPSASASANEVRRVDLRGSSRMRGPRRYSLMRRLGIWLLIAPLAIACGPGPRTETDAGPQPGDDGGPVVDPDSGTPGDPDGGPTCIDDDGDGYGEGCSLGTDCNDADPAVSPAATETCNGVDDDCDGTTDEELVAPSCDRTEGVCAGAVARCDGAAGFVCDAAQYGDDYEADETLCDGLDNDCDGTTDEGCTCEDGDTQPCGSDVGACMPGTQTCSGGTWGACSGEVTPMGEVCDGLDNDCDGSVDD